MEYTGEKNGEYFYYSRTQSKIGIQMNKHHHSLFEVYYMKSGSCSYLVDNSIFEVVSGDIILIPEGVIHKTNYGTEPHTRLLINCTRGYIPNDVQAVMDKIIYHYRNEKTVKDVDNIFHKIEEEIEKQDEFSQGIIQNLVQELFYLIARNQDKTKTTSDSSSFIEDCLKYVKENYSQSLTLTDVAKKHAVSPEHLSRTFKKETGFGFNEFVNLVRLQKAEIMLKNENGKSVSEIAYACGFNDSNYFSVIYKRTYGMTPSEAKKKIDK